MTRPPDILDGRERKKRATRRALRSATLDLALERGLDSVHINEITARAGVSPRTFFNYFETKEDAALIDAPGIEKQDLHTLSAAPSGQGLWTELGKLFADAAERTTQEITELPRLLQLQERTPALVARQHGRFMQFEAVLAEAVAARLDDGPSARMQAELIAGAAMIALRAGTRQWIADGQRRPAGVYVEEAFALLGELTLVGGMQQEGVRQP
ncbi:TetR/AcrR family transcriptional regulator [Streptomyces sp. NPDC013157]|uniref:TetR/AcrR family transcriptional regulator n=1 Tax=Streptomyces sp. NPDC013157 TaxID=3364861 RepID=UPI0036B3CA7B